jgi:hypothetical protein
LYFGRFPSVHIGDPSPNQVTSFESQPIHSIQEVSKRTLRRLSMRQFTVSTATAIVLAAMLSTAPAKAEYNYGPAQNAGQCWKASPSSRDFGFWGACPKPASATVTRTVHHARQH